VDNSLTVALESAPIHLDPRVATDQASSRVFELVLDGLVTKDERGDFVPALAESWEALDGGARWRFHLRPGVRFHDGSSFGAEDVVWTFGTLLDGTVTSSKRGAFSYLQRVVAIDPATVDFELDAPFGALLPNLTSYLGIVPEGALPETMNRAPVGTGAFRFVSRTADTVELAAFDGAYRGRPTLDRVVLREIPEATVRVLELRKGSVQLVVNALPPDVVPLFQADPRFTVPTSVGANYVYLGLNLTDPLLGDARVRRALALALDREQLVRTLWRGLGVVTETLLPPGNWARNDDLPATPFDPDAARRLLDEAGHPDPDGDGPEPRLHLTYKTSTDETAVLQAQILQAMWRRIGVDVEIRSYEFATFYADIKRGNFQLFSLTWTGIADPDIYMLVLHSKRAPPAGSNRGRYANPKFDALIEQGARLADPPRSMSR
jgi:peptide/nickel transport system substrate-binding protein